MRVTISRSAGRHPATPGVLPWTSALSLALLAACVGAAHGELPSMAEVEKAVLATDSSQGSLQATWEPVQSLLADVTPRTDSPVLRLIKGHASLALNANDHAWSLFLSVHTREKLQEWDEWTGQFSERHGSSPSAHYLQGDAKARLQRWEAAIAHFARVLQLNPRHALALNAAGVTRAQCGQLDEARKHFHRAATYTEGCLADAHANTGMLRIQSKDGADGARRAFDRALNPPGDSASGSFALALHGKGCVELILGEHGTASTSLEDALATGCGVLAAELMTTNHFRYAVSVSGGDCDVMLAELDPAGTTLRRDYQNLEVSAAAWQGTAADLRTMNWLPFNQRLADFAGNRSVERQEAIHKAFGDDGLRKLYSNHSKMDFHQEAHRVAGYNRQMEPALAKSERALAVTSGLTGVGALATIKAPPVAVTLGTISAATYGASEINRVEKVWANTHGTFGNTVDRVFGPSSRTIPDTPANPAKSDGGVLLSPAEVVWDDGQWPFEAHYVLAYETIAKLSNHSPIAQEGRRNDVQSQ